MFPTKGLLQLALSAFFILGASANGDAQIQHEHLDEIVWDRDVFPAVLNCGIRNETSIASQWIRLAYHDQSTHNIDDGTGGLDASIVYELNSNRNLGIGMRDTIKDFFPHRHPEVSMSDIIAAGVVISTPACGGPLIPLRAGRVDASQEGPDLVPIPQDDLPVHVESFRQQGFSVPEMIKLVACGHTVGGVRNDDRPDIVPKPGMTLFDGTQPFDAAVVTGYLDGTTQNPLVVGPALTNSDGRIFGADGNVTMQSIATEESFNEACAEVFERMIDVVPVGVKLTEPVEPLKYKIGPTRLYPGAGDNAANFLFQTNVRAWGSKPARSAKLFYNDRLSDEVHVVDKPTLVFRNDSSVLSNLKGLKEHQTYEFLVPVNATTSISKFWFEVDEADGSAPAVVNSRSPTNTPLTVDQDTVLYDRARSDVETGKFVVAVKGDASATVSVQTHRPVFPGLSKETHTLTADSSYAPALGYTFYSTTVDPLALFFDITAEVGGETIKLANLPRSDRGFISL